MRISDWSSDVCSSDLELAEAADRDFVTLGRGVGDNGKDGVDGLAGVGLAEIQRCGDAVRQFGMIHLGTLLYLAGRWPGGKSLYGKVMRSEEPTSELQSLIRTSYDVFCLKKKNTIYY